MQIIQEDEKFYNEFIVYLYNSFQSQLKQEQLTQQNLQQYRKMHIQPLFPNQIIHTENQVTSKEYTCSKICCDIDTGSFFCGKSVQPSPEMKIFGLGIALYFKYVKYLALYFLLASIVCIVPLFLYYLVSNLNNLLVPTDINSILFSSTIGTLSASSIKCLYGNNNKDVKLLPNCSLGSIYLYPVVYSNNSYVNLKNCNNQISNANSNTNILSVSAYEKTCQNSNCTIKTNSNINTSNTYLFISAPFSCQSIDYPIAGNTISNRQIVITLVTCDIFIVLLFLIFSMFQRCSQTAQKDIFLKKQTCLNDFAIQLNNVVLNQNKQKNDLSTITISKFIKQLKILLEEKGVLELPIAKIKIPQSEQKIDRIQRRKNIYFQLLNLFTKEIFQKSIQIDKLNYESFSKVVDYPKLKKKLLELIEQYSKQNQNLIEKSPKTQKQVLSIFIIFQSNLTKYQVLKACQTYCFSRYLKIGENQIKIKQAPIPDLILWKNFNRNSFFRTLISWIITIIILVFSYVLIAYAYNQKNALIAKYNYNVDCSLKYPNKTIYTQWNQSYADDSVWINCYCSNNLLAFTSHNECLNWLKGFTFYNLSPIFVSLIIVVYNMIVSFIFRKLSQFQGHKQITYQLFSYILKRTILLLLNTALVIVIINMKLDVNLDISFVYFLFGGTYSSITADWYYNIGIVILFTMLFNIVMPLVELFIQWLLNFFFQMYDKRCWTTMTSKKTKTQYFALYSGIPFPIQERYAQILSILFITFAYNQVIPLLNVFGFFNFLILFISDKILVFKFFRLKHYDEKLQQLVRKTALLAVFIHLLTSLFFLSQPTLNPILLSNKYTEIFGNTKLGLIAKQIQVYPYLILIALSVIWFIFQNTLGVLIQNCVNNIHRFSYMQEKNNNLYDILNPFQLQNLDQLNKQEFLRLQHEIDMINLSHSHENNATIEEMKNDLPSMFRLVQQGKIAVAKQTNLQKFDEYSKIVYGERTHIIQKLRKPNQFTDQSSKLLGMVGYDHKLSGDNKQVFQKMIKLDGQLARIYNQNISFLQMKKK